MANRRKNLRCFHWSSLVLVNRRVFSHFRTVPFSSPEPLGLICNRSGPRDQETTGSGDENGTVPPVRFMVSGLANRADSCELT